MKDIRGIQFLLTGKDHPKQPHCLTSHPVLKERGERFLQSFLSLFFSFRFHRKDLTKHLLFRTPQLALPLLFFSGLLTLSGCTGLYRTEKTETEMVPFYEKSMAIEEWQGYSPGPRKRELILPPKEPPKTHSFFQSDIPQRPLPEKAITLQMHEMDVKTLLRALSKSVGLNTILSENIKGTISINVDKSPWRQVFMAILKTRGLSYAWEGDILRILTLEDEQRRIKQLEAERLLLTQKRELAKVEPLLTRVVQIDYANANDLKKNLQSFLTQQNEGKSLGTIMVNQHTNALIVQGTRSDLHKILLLIKELDRPTLQILIEAHIVETSSDTARELGIQWGGLHKNGMWLYPGANSSGILGGSLSEGGIDPTSDFAINFPAPLSEGLGFTVGAAFETIGKGILAIQLSALQKEGRLKILSSPSITTLDNQAAHIESGTEVPYQTVSDGEVKIEYKKAVLSLLVTPHVIEGETLKLQIDTRKDELDFSRTVGGNPTIITKKAKTNVILFDGQTTVIGGLNKETRSQSDYGVPGLKNIPLLGYLFKGETYQDRMEEILIFITPYILKEKP